MPKFLSLHHSAREGRLKSEKQKTEKAFNGSVPRFRAPQGQKKSSILFCGTGKIFYLCSPNEKEGKKKDSSGSDATIYKKPKRDAAAIE
ncbi:hypothetical protein, partial [Sphingobacterium griseoflavum]